jgi:hypothetical protein
MLADPETLKLYFDEIAWKRRSFNAICASK